MKVLALVTALCLGSCAGGVPEPKDARAVLAQAIVYAQDAAEVTKTICTLQPDGKPCLYMVLALDEIFARGAQIEAALNAGEDMAEEVAQLEAELQFLVAQARNLLKGMV